MHPTRRHERILAELRVHGALSASDFAEREGISAMTVRRDLSELADRGVLRRVHGGAVSVETLPTAGAPHRPAPRPDRDTTDGSGALFTLGLVVPDPGYYFPKIVAGVAERTEALGGRVVLGVSRYEPARERQQVERLIAAGVDGLLVTTTVADAFTTLELLDHAPMPVVVVERSVVEAPVGSALESVRSDHESGAGIAVRHLAELGHRRIGMAVFDTPTTPQLRTGYDRAVRQLGLDPDAPVQVIPDDQGVGATTRAFIKRCLATGTTAVFVHSDQYAVEFVETVTEMGLSIPDDLSVVAYDDEVAALAGVPLTAVAPPKNDVGRFAATMCFERISATAQVGFARRHMTLAPTLSVRASTAAVVPGP
ncbi:substrate-binding domain-containing protein [Curtobacterium sp. VKM Ac-2884]|uniref:substrate-binding domain-containing protein n=1 Tax=Curtobacterium sp. VKM Ac-2884 TaxID=2783818 RepID=UPI00188A1C75|nr:substrate-binding domain-containing protein [Curtobacterium sp. VKM Ac-2884]MBF4604375.1 DeoR/GlpR family transcriptional regulator [Curtobacterium sp. VKM Ac-2884]